MMKDTLTQKIQSLSKEECHEIIEGFLVMIYAPGGDDELRTLLLLATTLGEAGFCSKERFDRFKAMAVFLGSTEDALVKEKLERN